MTPQFALSLSFDGIRLLHNAQGGWRVLGDVALDNPNLAAAMQALADLARQTGQDTDVYCKVILPDAQIKYLCLPPSDTPQDAARAALTGTTPYPVNALVIDTVQTQDHLFVAATARETLHEADAFLRGHGFTPSHFAGVPPADLFPKEPYFDGPPPLFIASGDPAAARQRPSDTPEKTPDETADEIPSDTPDETAVTPADGGPMPPHQPDLFPADTPPAAPATPKFIPPQAKPPAPRRLGSLIVLVVGLGVAGLAAASLGSGLLRLLAPQTAPAPHSTAKAPDPALPPEALTTQPPTQAPSTAPSAAPSAAPPPQDPLYANPKAFYRRHGISIAPPLQSKAPAPGTLDRLYLTSIDPISIQLDAIALPNPAGYTTDSAPAPVPSPPSPRTRFSFDQDGLVIPQKDGALSPDGYTVYAGKPWVVPPPPPVRFETNPIADLERQRLSATRPRLRPDSLSENNQRAALGGLTRDELSQLRPRLRPQSAQETALAAQPPGAAATPLALVPRPPLRPNTLAAPQSPQPQASAPNIPSSASISRQATRKNALALGRINLIGIYGKSSDRRALVRLANGRYVKVEVGDSLDGGRILAISETELRYQKSGRNHVLKMPKG